MRWIRVLADTGCRTAGKSLFCRYRFPGPADAGFYFVSGRRQCPWGNTGRGLRMRGRPADRLYSEKAGFFYSIV